MGYSTDFEGSFELNKKLDKETHKFLNRLNETRRMARSVDAKYGVEGEFYVDGEGMCGQDSEANILDYNRPPKTQPGLWCQWKPTEDGTEIEWDGGEKFYNYVEWITYIIEKILAPRGYALSGEISWQGESPDDLGIISISNNEIAIKQGITFFLLKEDIERVTTLVDNYVNSEFKKALTHAIDKKTGRKHHSKKVV